MKVYPHNALEQLDFSRLLDDISKYSAGVPTAERIQYLLPTTQIHDITESLRQIQFFTNQITEGHYLSLVSFDVPDELERGLTIEDYALSRTSFIQLRHILDNSVEISRYFKRCEEDAEEALEIPFDAFPDLSTLKNRLHEIFDELGEIQPNASEELLAITRRINRKQGEISTVFGRMAKQYRSQGLLSEFEESYRNGRRVLALPAENKRKIQGIIHGESESGKTVFIEPQAVTEVNNALFQLEADKQKEEYKILKQLTSETQMHADEIRTTIELLIELDAARAKAVYSHKRGFAIPKFDTEVSFHLKEAFHPHLEEHLKKDGKVIVKNDVVLHGKNRMLLLSGPNAGGKSVSLKTVAFAQLMFQCGLPVPASPDSKMSVFSAIALDMGDNQSMEDDLSTYSSHLDHMKSMLELADENSLLLIDEFGTGTDPRVGGALAESILHQFVKRGCSGIITTHYSNLKSYAHKTRGIVNGSMSFDMESLSPTYLIQIGKPGSSFAFEIAKRMGLPAHVIDRARKKAGSQVYEMEKLLSQLEHEKKIIAEKSLEIERQELELKVLRKTYTDLKNQLDIQRKKYKAERKQELARLKSQNVEALEELLKEYKDIANAERKIEEKIKKEKEVQAQQIRHAHSLNQEVHQMTGTWLRKEDLAVGQFVRIRDTDSSGKVLAINKKTARVAVGPLSVDVPYENLVKANSPLEINSKRSVTYDRPTSSIPGRLDIRGLSYKEAKSTLVKYFDDALVRHMHQVEILHGKGNGVLRKLVEQVARDYKDIREVRHPEDDAGGESISIVCF